MNTCKKSKIWRLVCIMLVIAIITSLTACYGNTSRLTEKPNGSVAAREGYKLTTDCIGRKVEVPASPKRIAALDSFAGEAMVMIGAGDKMIAAPNGVKTDLLLQRIYPNMQKVGVPMAGAAINAETLMALQPDLIFIKEAMYLTEGERAKLDKLGVPYLVVGYDSMEEQINALHMIGESIGSIAAEKAAAINQYYRKVIVQAKEIQRQIPEKDRFRVYHAINEIVRTDGAKTLGNDWISSVGAIDISAGGQLKFYENDYFASMEQIYQWDPDIIICNEADTVVYLMEDSKWQGLRAVREHRVYNIPVGATRWGQRGSLETFFAILWLGTTIYPEQYKDVDLKKEVLDFYNKILGLKIDDHTYELILSGNGIRNKSSGEKEK
ncbi:ABC transporter substrate-binding protein [Paenibacillus sabinae]|uniref:Ferrichrome-binding periplasmic protein n=1 Tax=Paenibacillus sabinae T27 TaxID=1268072 RepID=X4ZNU2_9BACL|nr:ABC transporter substrate-binding protein [Paenibacillus sabinae]AHV98822.1 ferrichrome-binding periplasmic protein [Paenibacillus sabinae T27]